jgi:hypothetical protein
MCLLFSKKLQAKLEQPRIVINFEGKFWKREEKALPHGQWQTQE